MMRILGIDHVQLQAIIDYLFLFSGKAHSCYTDTDSAEARDVANWLERAAHLATDALETLEKKE